MAPRWSRRALADERWPRQRYSDGSVRNYRSVSEVRHGSGIRCTAHVLISTLLILSSSSYFIYRLALVGQVILIISSS